MIKFAGATVKQHHHHATPTLCDDTPDTAIIQGACNNVSNQIQIAKILQIMGQIRYSFHQLYVQKSFVLIAARNSGRDC